MSKKNLSLEKILVKLMTRKVLLVVQLILLPIILCCNSAQDSDSQQEGVITSLPEPNVDSEYSLEKALANRRSVRQYSNEPLSVEEVSQLLWSAQGITLPQRGFRTAPSAGATYPLHLYLNVSNVSGLEQGLYKYHPEEHTLIKVSDDDKRQVIYNAGLRQGALQQGVCIIIITAEYDRTTGRYGERGIKYVHNEVGHVGQNVSLQVESLGLGTVVIGAFDDNEIKTALSLPDNIEPLYLMPVGRK